MRLILYPLIWILQIAYLSLTQVIGSYGLALIFLSLITSHIMAWLGGLIKRYPEREALVQSLMQPKLKAIKKDSNSQNRHQKTVALYKRYNYHPILALRSAFPLFLQLPFLFAAYHMLSRLELLQGVSFWMIRDLSAPDALLAGINLMPIIMTVLNISTALLTTTFSPKDKTQAFVIAGLFLILLYNAASALLVYWTMNNIVFLIRTLLMKKHGDTILKVGTSGISQQSFAKLIAALLPFLKQYLALLCIFYVYQAVALPRGYHFPSYLKYIPFFVAAFGFFSIQLYDLKIRFESTFRYAIAGSIAGALLLVVLTGISLSLVLGLLPILEHPVIFNSMAYMLMFSAFAMGLLMPSEKRVEPVRPLLRILILLIPPLIPAVHYARVNSEYLMGQYNVLFYLVISSIAALSYTVLRASAGHRRSKSDSALKAAIFTLLLISLPLIRFGLRQTSKVDIDFWLMLFITIIPLGLINSRIRFIKALQVSGLILLVFIVSGFFTSSDSSSGTYKRKVLSDEFKQIVFNEKPNIYLFVYDGIPNERVFREQNLPFAGLKQVLDDHGFKLYADTYTLGEASLNSMGRMLDFSDRVIKGPEGRDIYTGNSWTNLILRNNGYKSRFLLDNYYTGYAAITHADLFEEMYPPRSATATKSDYFVVLMRGILQGEMRFDTKGLVSMEDADAQDYKLQVIREQKESTFVVNHYHYPGHSQNSGKCLPNENEIWIGKLDIALKQMEADFLAIKDYDHNSIVIAIGDHGPALSGDCYDLAAWKKEDITPDLIWDRIGTMVAIRWPDKEKAAKYDEQIVTNQDVFPVLFSYLADNPNYLKLCPDNVFWGLGTPLRTEIGFDKGNIIRYPFR